MICDAKGNPLMFTLTPGNIHDSTAFDALLMTFLAYIGSMKWRRRRFRGFRKGKHRSNQSYPGIPLDGMEGNGYTWFVVEHAKKGTAPWKRKRFTSKPPLSAT